MTATEKPLVTYTKFNGAWMLRSNVKLTDENTEKYDYPSMDGTTTPRNCVAVAKRDGSTKVEKIGEYEHCFKNSDGDAHIYSIL